jgi:hypothetical protein
MDIYSQCPRVLAMKAGRGDGKEIGSGGGRRMKSGAIREVGRGPTALDQKPYSIR